MLVLERSELDERLAAGDPFLCKAMGESLVISLEATDSVGAVAIPAVSEDDYLGAVPWIGIETALTWSDAAGKRTMIVGETGQKRRIEELADALGWLGGSARP